MIIHITEFFVKGGKEKLSGDAKPSLRVCWYCSTGRVKWWYIQLKCFQFVFVSVKANFKLQKHVYVTYIILERKPVITIVCNHFHNCVYFFSCITNHWSPMFSNPNMIRKMFYNKGMKYSNKTFIKQNII